MSRSRGLNQRTQEVIYKLVMNILIEDNEIKDNILSGLRKEIADRCKEVLSYGYKTQISNWEHNLEHNLMPIFPAYIPKKIQEKIRLEITRKIKESRDLEFFR